MGLSSREMGGRPRSFWVDMLDSMILNVEETQIRIYIYTYRIQMENQRKWLPRGLHALTHSVDRWKRTIRGPAAQNTDVIAI